MKKTSKKQNTLRKLKVHLKKQVHLKNSGASKRKRVHPKKMGASKEKSEQIKSEDVYKKKTICYQTGLKTNMFKEDRQTCILLNNIVDHAFLFF